MSSEQPQEILAETGLGDNPNSSTTCDVDMTEMDELLDYGDDDTDAMLTSELDSNGEEPEAPESNSSSENCSSGSADEVEVSTEELIKEPTEDTAQTKSLRGGENEQKMELERLRGEIVHLRRQRDIATQMSTTARDELGVVKKKLTKDIGQMSVELRSERRRVDAKEDEIEAMRQKLDEAEDELDDISRERARSRDQRRRSRSARSKTPTTRTRRSRSPDENRRTRSRSPTRSNARSKTPVSRTHEKARTTTAPQASRGRARTPTGPRNRDASRAPVPQQTTPSATRQTLSQGSAVLDPKIGMRDPAFDTEEMSRFAYAAKRFGTVTPPQRINYKVDARGYPVDKDGWWTTFQLQQREPVFVHGLRHLFMYAYARDVPEDERTELQQLSIKYYFMSDWFAGRLSVIDIYREENLKELREWPYVRREFIKFNPELLAQFFQYREMTIRGCRFLDDCWSLDGQAVRTENLRDVFNLTHRRPKTDGAPTDDERLIRYLVDKYLMILFLNPGMYKARLKALNIHVVKEFALSAWPDHFNVNITSDDVVKRLAECGVCVALMDDGFVYALRWCEDTELPLPWGWDATFVATLAEEAAGRTAPPPILPHEIWTRTPCLPWLRNAENIIQFDMSHWRQPELSGMRRTKGSTITKQLLLTPIDEAPNLGLLRPNNPYLRALGPQIPGVSAADAALIMARNGITKKSSNRRSANQAMFWINPRPRAPPFTGFRSDGDRSMIGSMHATPRPGPSLLTRMSLPDAGPSTQPRVSLPSMSPSTTTPIDDGDATMDDAPEDTVSSLPQGCKFIFGSLESLPPPTPEQLAVENFAFSMIHGTEINRYCDFEKDYVTGPQPM
ncbi:hypothetical protein DFH06DRAFT_1347934 [Mycena polygramma]|nr:hypothetical protein DFH06DRAFT_1347934 [Mycena polygramma]